MSAFVLLFGRIQLVSNVTIIKLQIKEFIAINLAAVITALFLLLNVFIAAIKLDEFAEMSLALAQDPMFLKDKIILELTVSLKECEYCILIANSFSCNARTKKTSFIF